MLFKITIESCSGGPIQLLRYHNKALQGVLYHSIGEQDLSSFLHNDGYAYEKRTFKLFAFSDILERYVFCDKEKHFVEFPSVVSWLVSSVDDKLLQGLFQGIGRAA